MHGDVSSWKNVMTRDSSGVLSSPNEVLRKLRNLCCVVIKEDLGEVPWI